jgi:hypothetical protein
MNLTGKQNVMMKTGKEWIERHVRSRCSGWIAMWRNFSKMICDLGNKICCWKRKT